MYLLLEGLIVRMLEIMMMNYLSGFSVYILINFSVDLFIIERDYYLFLLEDSIS